MKKIVVFFRMLIRLTSAYFKRLSMEVEAQHQEEPPTLEQQVRIFRRSKFYNALKNSNKRYASTKGFSLQ